MSTAHKRTPAHLVPDPIVINVLWNYANDCMDNLVEIKTENEIRDNQFHLNRACIELAKMMEILHKHKTD